ncbi:aminoglycoside phosphotransferase family protein [Shimia aestuarii]|uniref:Aminoglycoside phosphotransferase domain-containing protein n=1 Tax=Shimia aestuarii TaxID=254406 RepID=A0A1I4KH19_9RHOB|nr:phosphotransferase [Shimia aestuarii]SFL77747.1 hypothetical protein SAMN04488042_1011466 [Shimia aestuarii]
MSERNTRITRFLEESGWNDAARASLAGDASNRRYERITRKNGEVAVLMDAPPDKNEPVTEFVHIAKHLRDTGLSAPEILACDTEHGLLLIEDLGDDLFARVLVSKPDQEMLLYAAATDVLVALHQTRPPSGLKTYGPEVMTNMAALSYDWYARGADLEVDRAKSRFMLAFRSLLDQHANDTSVLVQRDYHAENLLWLPDRRGVARVGLLDFQDAMLGHPAYDLVSLLQDARRDVSSDVETAMIARYLAVTDVDPEHFQTAYAVLGVQRNLRILGAFARLSMHFAKPHYVDLIPRVWGFVLRDLEHPALAAIREQVLVDLPEPSPALLQKLKDKCGKYPVL